MPVAVQPIDLAKSRVLAFAVGERAYTLTVKPVSEKAWLKYFAGIVSVQENTADGISSTFDSTGARLELLESVLTDATGYTKEGESITSVAGWQAKLPMAHRRAAADLLAEVEVVKPEDLGEDDYPSLGTEVVVLKAIWTADDNGKMQQLTGLKHVFTSPTADHQKRYSRAMSRSIVTGGSRNGQTRWLGAQDVLIEIYNELIHATDGYVFGAVGQDFDPVAAMDAYHKVVATTALFTPLEVATA